MSQDFKKCPVTHLTTEAGAPVVDNQNSMTAGGAWTFTCPGFMAE